MAILNENYFRASIDCIIITNIAGEILEFNPAAEVCFLQTKQSVLGSNIKELICLNHYSSSKDNSLLDIQNINGEFVVNQYLETEAKRANKKKFHIELTITPFDDEGKINLCFLLKDKSTAMSEKNRIIKSLENESSMWQIVNAIFENAAFSNQKSLPLQPSLIAKTAKTA